MTYRLGPRSTFNLSTCCSQIRSILAGSSTETDFTVVSGHIGRREAWKRGDKYMTLPEHAIPSRACVIVPNPTDDTLHPEAFLPIIRVIAKHAKLNDTKLRVQLTDRGLYIAVADWKRPRPSRSAVQRD